MLAEDKQKQLRKEVYTINLEIDSYNKQLAEIEMKEGNNGKGGAGGLQNANNAMKSSIHQKLMLREREKFDISRQLEEQSRAIEDNRESAEIFEKVSDERRRNLINKFLASHQGLVDLEQLVKALYDLFHLIKLTSLDSLTSNTTSDLSSGSLLHIRTSTDELKKLRKQLQCQRVDRDDVRFDIFKQLFDIIEDDIDMRLLNNRQLEAIVELNRSKVASQLLMNSGSGNASRMQMTPGGNNSMNDTLVMKKGEMMTPGGGDFDKRKNQRSMKALEVIGDSKTEKGTTPTPGKEKSAKKAFRVCS